MDTMTSTTRTKKILCGAFVKGIYWSQKGIGVPDEYAPKLEREDLAPWTGHKGDEPRVAFEVYDPFFDTNYFLWLNREALDPELYDLYVLFKTMGIYLPRKLEEAVNGWHWFDGAKGLTETKDGFTAKLTAYEIMATTRMVVSGDLARNF